LLSAKAPFKNLEFIRRKEKMKPKKFRAALQERPWLLKAIGSVTGVSPYFVHKNGGIWERHVTEWGIRNITEITVRRFEDLDLNKKAEFVRYQIGPDSEEIIRPNGYSMRWRQYQAFTHTHYSLFTHSTYEEKWSKRFSRCWDASGTYEEGGSETLKEVLRRMSGPHYRIGTKKVINNPTIFDALVCITKVGITGMCSSAIVDIYEFPLNPGLTK
jgi:hypothetical protein